MKEGSAHVVGQGFSPLPIDNPPTAQVIRGQLNRDDIARHDADEMLPHLPGNVGQHFMLRIARLSLYEKLGVGQRLDHLRFDLNTVRSSHLDILNKHNGPPPAREHA